MMPKKNSFKKLWMMMMILKEVLMPIWSKEEDRTDNMDRLTLIWKDKKISLQLSL